MIKKHSDTYLFLLAYHPPRPVYKPNSLVNRLISDVELLTDKYPTATIYLTGDFNRLNISLFLSDSGLQQIVTHATRGTSILDLFMTNRPSNVQYSVVQSCMKTDHSALLVNCDQHYPTNPITRSRYKATFYDLRQPNIDALAAEISNYNWTSVLDTTNIDLAYEAFLSSVSRLLTL